MTDTEALLPLIGPLPEQPKTPEAPTPWEKDANLWYRVNDVNGGLVADFENSDVAALVVELVNAAASGQARREVDHYVDEDGSVWSVADNGRYYITPTQEAANAKLARHGDDSGCSLEYIVELYGAKPVYKP